MTQTTHGRTDTVGSHSHEAPGSSDSRTREDAHWDPLPRGPGVIRLADTGGPTPTRSQGRQTRGHGRTRIGTHSHEVPGRQTRGHWRTLTGTHSHEAPGHQTQGHGVDGGARAGGASGGLCVTGLSLSVGRWDVLEPDGGAAAQQRECARCP